MKKLVVDKDLCIGCGTCVVLAPKTFKTDADGKAEPIEPPGDNNKVIQEGIDSCPVTAIRWSSSAKATEDKKGGQG